MIDSSIPDVHAGHTSALEREARKYGEGYVYIIEFASGILKVGHTRNLDERLAGHAAGARIHNNEVMRTWTSLRHKSYIVNESALIDFCAHHGQLSHGREYFCGVSFSDVVDFAKTLKYELLSDDEIIAKVRRSQAQLKQLNQRFNIQQLSSGVERLAALATEMYDVLENDERLLDVLVNIFEKYRHTWDPADRAQFAEHVINTAVRICDVRMHMLTLMRVDL